MKRAGIIHSVAGSAAVEFALAVPVLISVVWGMFQLSMVMEANAGVSHALGQAARMATLYVPSTGQPPTSAAVSNQILASRFGIRGGNWHTPNINTSHASAANGGYWDITVQYDVPTDFLFFTGPTVTLTRTKRVYLAV